MPVHEVMSDNRSNQLPAGHMVQESDQIQTRWAMYSVQPARLNLAGQLAISDGVVSRREVNRALLLPQLFPHKELQDSPAMTGNPIRAREPAEPNQPSSVPCGCAPTTFENKPKTLESKQANKHTGQHEAFWGMFTRQHFGGNLVPSSSAAADQRFRTMPAPLPLPLIPTTFFAGKTGE